MVFISNEKKKKGKIILRVRKGVFPVAEKGVFFVALLLNCLKLKLNKRHFEQFGFDFIIDISIMFECSSRTTCKVLEL